MIIDNVNNASTYHFNDGVKKAIEFCKNAKGKEAGRYDITDSIYCFIQKYDSAPIENCNNEAHRKYIDLQYVVEGKETMGFCNIDLCQPTMEYNDTDDFQLFKNCPMGYLGFDEGDFAFFFPQDVHMPRGEFEKSMAITKVVVKIPVGEF